MHLRHWMTWGAVAAWLAAACGADVAPATPLTGGDGAAATDSGGFVIKPKDAGPTADAPGPADALPLADVVACTPNELLCLGPTTSATCKASGGGVTKVIECPTGKFCRPETGLCQPPLCTPIKVECLDQASYRTCASDGSAWSEPQACPDKYLCSGDECVYENCMGHVLLVVDRSGSMFDHWNSVLKSMVTLIQENPKARFGLVGFPIINTACDVRAGIEVALEPDNVASFIDWFSSNQPYGWTPLKAAMTAVEGFAPTLFAGVPGTIVVLSDGADTCDVDVVTALAAITSDLWTQHEIQTYVIGYAFEDQDTSQLDAMAANGGTKHTTYIAAGNETELTNAFKGIVSDFKLCF
jgi:hypothetical protein